jgi:o-succinylbenzoate synthase
MKELNAELHQLQLPLKSTLGTSRWSIHARDVIILQLRDPESGFSGYGESAPLEQFGTESINQALYAFAQIMEERPFDNMLSTRLDDLALTTCSYSATPTVRYALESAVLDLQAKREGVPLHVYLGGDEETEQLLVNALIGDGDARHAQVAASRAMDEGFACIKMKVAARDLEEDIDRVTMVRDTIGADALLRLDANGGWTRKQSERAIHLLESMNIEYIEQPLGPDDIDGLTGLAADSPIPIAADESLRNAEDIEILMDSAIPVFILKPMALGSVAQLRSLARRLHSSAKKVIFTSFIDSAIGRAAAMHLAASLPFSKDYYHGFATGAMFARDTANMDEAIGSMLRLPGANGIGFTPDLEKLRTD